MAFKMKRWSGYQNSPLNQKDNNIKPNKDWKVDSVNKAKKDWPALENLGEITERSDKGYDYGYGSIEYMSPSSSEYSYKGSEKKLTHPKKGTHGVVYNPDAFETKEDLDQAVKLDLLHAMREEDPEFQKHLRKFEKDFLRSNNGDLYANNERLVEEGTSQGFQKDSENYIDGVIRNMLFEGEEEDFSRSNYWPEAKEFYSQNENIKNSFSQIKNYLETGYENILPEVEIKSKK
tara:strand:+ start:40 stop:738 length:699 start_codon:yes stop_codon:yes gene_type:complete